MRDPASPSGWRFRGSYQGAVNAYRRALEIVPSVHLAFRGQGFSRLPQLLYTETNHIRQGYALTPDTVRFGAFPSMTHDTLEFVPHRIEAVVAAVPGTIPSTVTAAVSANRELMRDIATTWVTAFPRNADAHETLSLVLETLGELSAGRSKDYSALSEIRKARTLARDPAAALRMVNGEVRLLLKSEHMSEARRLADSLLRANPNPMMENAQHLRGLAALVGRVNLAAQLQRRAAPDYTFLAPDWQEIKLPLSLTDAALGLFAYASFGAPLDSIVALEHRVERLIPSYVPPDQRTSVRQASARSSGGARVPRARTPARASPWQCRRKLPAGDAVEAGDAATQRSATGFRASCAGHAPAFVRAMWPSTRPTRKPGSCSPSEIPPPPSGSWIFAQCASDTRGRPAGSAATGGDSGPGNGLAC